jgi:hypothetical protein
MVEKGWQGWTATCVVNMPSSIRLTCPVHVRNDHFRLLRGMSFCPPFLGLSFVCFLFLFLWLCLLDEYHIWTKKVEIWFVYFA